MTDKETIMIDGVDVNECAYFDYENEGTRECDAYGNECEANNCYFKQLARKTQELETICKAFDIEYSYDEETGAIVGRCNKLIEKEKALEEIEKVLLHCVMTGAIVKILYIINKAKDGE